ncbi:MAG: universal stress protein [Nitrospiraceae bacterium]|nr:universal stress protein [Nitrospiraceae bacterium]
MKILLAVDGSKYSEAAAGFLGFLDLSEKDEITVFHALDVGRLLRNEAAFQSTLKEIKKLFEPGIFAPALEILKPVKAKVCTAVIEGPAKQVIVEKAAEAGMDLIVMGARGTKGVESVLLGSVSRTVSIKSHVPVLVVKTPLNVKRGGMRILFATDGSAYSSATCELLASMPFPQNSRLTVLNVIRPVTWDFPITIVPEINEQFAGLIRDAREKEKQESARILSEARQKLENRFSEVEVSTVEGDASGEILAGAEGMKADLVAVGCRGLTGLKGMIGSVSRNVLHHSKCAVLIGKLCVVP